jgi:carboxymethylenebutenolidase
MPSSTLQLDAADGVADAYLARPDEEPRPGILFIMDAYGLRPVIYELADRIARDGYVVLAPNVFYRAGALPVPDMSDEEARASHFQTVRPLMAELTPERMAADGAAYLDRLGRDAAPGPVAVTGYCMGGRLGWRIATSQPDRVAALAAFHPGGLVTDAPDSPHRSAKDVRSELYLGFADQDPSMNAEQIATLEHSLDDAGVRYRAEVYAGAKHGYTMADTPAFDEAARERHFRELRGLLERTLG